MAATASPRLRLDFANLPLVEAAIRATLRSPVRISYELVNAVHKELSSDFPAVAEPQHFERGPGLLGNFEFGSGQLPGAVFLGHPKGVSVSLQTQVIIVRWVRRLGTAGPDYPRYPVLREALTKSLDAVEHASRGVQSAADATTTGLSAVNMSYVNFLRISHSEPVLRKYFHGRAHVEMALNAKELHKLEVAWKEASQIDLRLRLDQVIVQVPEQKIEGFQLTTIAGLLLSHEQDAMNALDDVHQRLQEFFRDAISEEAKQEWKLQEATE